MTIDKLLIIPDKKNIDVSLDIASRYGCGFEYNDFFLPRVLDDEKAVEDAINFYRSIENLPDYCTCHGAFFDVTVFSDDSRIREVSDYRVKQSLEISSALGAKGVIFHTNYMPNFTLESYMNGWVEKNYEYWARKLEEYPDIDIYIENMFDTEPELLARLGERFADRDNFGVCFDYAHACVFGNPDEIDTWVHRLSPHVKHVHINDNDFKSDLHLALGDGMIDWQRFKYNYEKYFPKASVLVEMNGCEKIEKSLKLLQCL